MLWLKSNQRADGGSGRREEGVRYPAPLRQDETGIRKTGRVGKQCGRVQFAPLAEIREDQFHQQFNTNVLGLLWATQEDAKLFEPGGGSVINIGSTASRITPPTSVVYTATKGAVDAITHVLAKELIEEDPRPDDIAPIAVFLASTDSGWLTGQTLLASGGLQ